MLDCMCVCVCVLDVDIGIQADMSRVLLYSTSTGQDYSVFNGLPALFQSLICSKIKLDADSTVS